MDTWPSRRRKTIGDRLTSWPLLTKIARRGEKFMGSVYQRGGNTDAKWTGQYVDHNGRTIQRSTGTRSKRDAVAIVAKWELGVARRRSGLIDANLEALAGHSRKSLAFHAKDWIASLEAKKRKPKTVGEHESRLEKIISGTKWTNLADISATGLEQFLADLQKTGRYKKSAPRGPRTAGHYITTIKCFVNWCIADGRMNSSPLLTITKPNAEQDRRIERRMLLPKELPWLLAAARASTRCNVSPLQRPLLYEFAIQTGLRAKEIRSVKLPACELESERPFVALKKSQTKNSKAARQWITTGLAAKLKAMIATDQKSGKDPLFDLCSPSNTARMLRADMTAARQKWLEANQPDREELSKSDFLAIENFKGEKMDFHALRHTCGAWLVMEGVNIKTVQAVMRHSNISLTLDTYGHLMPGAEENAIPSIAHMFGE